MKAVFLPMTCTVLLSLVLTVAAAPPQMKANRAQFPSANLSASRHPSMSSPVASGLKLSSANASQLSKDRFHKTTTGVKDPWTGRSLSNHDNLGHGLPGGHDLSKDFPSAEQRWNNRFKGPLGGGTDYLGQGTPFDKKPGSSPMDDFLGQHGANLPDPLAASGTGRTGASPAQDGEGTGSVTWGEITVDHGTTSVICASDYMSAADLGSAGDECAVVQLDGQGDFKTEADRQIANDFLSKWVPGGSNGQQYEGEGGYNGGGGHSANDLTFRPAGPLGGRKVGGRDPGDAGLGQDSGERLPAQMEAINKYLAQGGKIRGAKAGFQGTDSGLGQDVGGAAAGRVSALKNALDAQRFVADPNARPADEMPWWIQEKVAPATQAAAASN
ncbi:MAG: hypothetical protein ACYC6Y_08800 [Thermoguttaceae bacterium]